jgi:hypothetical protein
VIIRRVLENRIAFAAIVLAFALAMGLNAIYGSGSVFPAHLLDAPVVVTAALSDDPTFPPIPWPGGRQVASLSDDPTFPPIPWPEGRQVASLSDDPTFPPIPWPEGRQVASLSDDPTFPPIPWPGGRQVA